MRTEHANCRLFYMRTDWDGIHRTAVYRWIAEEPISDISLGIFGVFPQIKGFPGAHREDVVRSTALTARAVVRQPTARATNAR